MRPSSVMTQLNLLLLREFFSRSPSSVVDGALYVRAYNGKESRWYKASLRQKAGRITAAGMTKEVTFEPVGGQINDRIDDAYRAKYAGSPYLKPMIGAHARAATVRVVPRETTK
jgi:hypothetical protein